MANSNIKKNAQGYGYKYTDLAEIHNYLESQGITYYQYTETADGVDYIVTVPIIDGLEKPPRRGCRVAEAKLSGKTNPAQEQGSAITYARRYSLLMAMGLATTDDDAACLTVDEQNSEDERHKELCNKIRQTAAAKDVTTVEICNRAGVKYLEEMPTAQLEQCINWLNRR